MSTFLNDIKYAFRMLGQSLGYTLVVVLTLAFGGATTSIVSLVQTTLFDPLPVRQASDRYVQLIEVGVVGAVASC